LLFQLKCSHLVPAKVPLPEEAILKHNQAAVERRRVERKEQHKEKEIAKCNRNGNRIKRRKEGEHNVSSNEDPSLSPPWSGDKPSVAVDWSDMSGSPSPSPHGAVKVSSSWRLEAAAPEKGAGCDNPPRKIPYYHLRPIHFGH
jgi:hypothetical protein